MSKHVLQTKSCGFFIKNYYPLFSLIIEKQTVINISVWKIKILKKFSQS